MRASSSVARSPITAAALLTAAAAAWAAAIATSASSAMETSAPAFLLAWVVMMTAMMLPSAAPLVLLWRRPGRWLLAGGYLLAWAAVGVPVYALQRAVELVDVPALAAASVLAAAGV